MGMQSEIESIGIELELMGMQSEIHSIGIEPELIGMHPEIHWQGNRNLNSWECSLSLESIGREIGTKASDPRINTRFRASPKAFIFYGLLKTRRPY